MSNPLTIDYPTLTTYKNGQIQTLWQERTQAMIAQAPKFSPLRCGEIIAAKIARQAGTEYASLETKVSPFCMSAEEVALYDWLANDNYNIKAELQDLSGSRTLLADMGNLDIPCPVCRAVSPSDEHLIQEYKSMMHAQFGAFKQNAADAQRKIAALLLARGITRTPNIFGDLEVQG